ncbi:peptidase S74 family domain-containing protein (plasmid) [Rhizobium etli]|uniref:Peptidase S74 family domain-containing protein n=1 Tax=Rhizobium etli TaxID=29449 RepID=A0AAN1BLS9_RHIET|nr:tail fiber domain-containing protein [Rhizobium etli]AGS24744.1 peptidase S74 family domain-containing protein [Rhizobium etli bv. mimosae str. Mim1]ARQ12767.1 peptidase S74 family domain-containing protein [Rhizobium etli]
MTSKVFIRVLLCSTFIAGSGVILQGCIFDPGGKTLFATQEPAQPARKKTPTVKRVVAKSDDRESTFARSDKDSSSGSSSGMGGGSSSDSSGSDSSDSGPSHGWESDLRLKTDIRRLGTSPAGIPIYAFRYIWGGPLFVGTMAQDLLLIRPDVLSQDATGYYTVDYARLDIRMISIPDELSLASPAAAAAVAALSVDAAKTQPLIGLPEFVL